MRTGLPVGVLLVNGLASVGRRLGVTPGPEKAVAKPMAQRQAFAIPRLFARPRPAGVSSADYTINTRGGPMRIRVHRPETVTEGPAVLYLHGGGFVLGGLDGCDWLCAEIAARTSYVVVAPEYRIAPEHKFPCALEDCTDAMQWLATGGIDGVAPSALAVAGDSAGGNLAAALALLARDGEAPAIKHQTLIYPFLDSTLTSRSWVECAGAGLDVSTGRLMLQWYVGDDGWGNPLVSPLSAPDLRGLPPTLVVTAGHDVLRDDGLAYVARLSNDGVPTQHLHYPRMPHGFLSMPRLCRDASPALTAIARGIAAVEFDRERGRGEH